MQFAHRPAARARGRAAPSYAAECLESRLLLVIWYSNYGESQSHLIYDADPGVAYDFEVNGIAADTTTRWYVDGTYLGAAYDDHSGFLALDPQLRWDFNTPGVEVRVEARVQESPVETHAWRVRTPDVRWSGGAPHTVEAGERYTAVMWAGPPHDAQATIYESESDLSTEPVVARLTFAGTSAAPRYAEWTAVWKRGRDVSPLQSYYLYYPPTEESSEYLVVIDTTPPAASPLISPADDAVITGSSVTFLWGAAEDSPYASGVGSYTLQVDDDPNFRSPLVNATNLPAPGRTASVSPLGTFYWRVLAYDNEGNGRASAVRTFRRMDAQVTGLSWRESPRGGTISGIHVGQTAYVRIDAVGLDGQTRQVAIWAVDQTDPEASTRVATIDVTIGNDGVGTAPWVTALPPGGSPDYAFQLRVASPIIRSDWLDVVDTPRVAQVFLHGSAWSPAFRAHLEQQAMGSSAYGWPIGAGAAQLADAPWTGADRVSVQFTEDVAVAQGDLAVHSSQAGVDYGFVPGAFSYDAATFTATWVLEHAVGSNPLVRRGGDSVRLELSADPALSVRAAITSGHPLDGDWSDGAHAYPSGDGSPGGAFAFTINVLPGNADRQFGRVNAGDQGYVKARINRSTTNPASPSGGAAYSVFADVTADGRVNAADQGAVKARLNTALPAASSSAFFGKDEIGRTDLRALLA